MAMAAKATAAAAMADANLKLAFNLPPERAIEYFGSRGLRTSANWQEAAAAVKAGAFSVAGVAKADVLDDIRQSMAKALADGQTYPDWLGGVKPMLAQRGWLGKFPHDPATGEILRGKALTPWRLETIFRTNLQQSYMSGRYKAQLENADRRGNWQYVAILDSHTRPRHRALNGRVFRYDDAAWGAIYPPNGYNCFPAETLIRANAELGLKTWYTGTMVELQSRGGHRLTLTANHPVLTGRGWLPAHEVKQDDQLLCDAGIVNAVVLGVVDDQQAPASAENLFETLRAQGFRVAPMAADDFHGDALLRKPEIHITGSDSHLVDEFNSASNQRIGQREFADADAGRTADAHLSGSTAQRRFVIGETMLAQQAADIAQAGIQPSGQCALGGQAGSVEGQDPPLKLRVAQPGSIPRGPDLAAHGSGIGFDLLPLNLLGGASSAQLNIIQLQRPAERSAAESGLITELLEANPGFVTLNDVTGVRQFDWAGYVFDFQTSTGLMFAGGILVHNCRCRVRAMTDEEMQAEDMTLSTGDGNMETITRELRPRGGQPNKVPVTGWRDPSTGELFTPDTGFDFSPARAAWGRDIALARNTQAIASREIRTQVWQALNNSPARATTFYDKVKQIVATRGQSPRPGVTKGAATVIGFLDEDVADFARKMDVETEPTRVLAITDKHILHADSNQHLADGVALSLDQYAALPGVIAKPDQVFWDTQNTNLAFVRYLVDGSAIYVPVTPARYEKKIGRIDALVTAYRLLPGNEGVGRLKNRSRFVPMKEGS